MTRQADFAFNWRSPKAALKWLWLLYRRPSDVHTALSRLPRITAFKTSFVLFVYFVSFWLPLAYLLAHCGRFALKTVENQSLPRDEIITLDWVALEVTMGITIGMVVGLASGLTSGLVGRLGFIVGSGILVGVSGGVGFGIVGGIVIGVVFGTVAGVTFGIAGGSPVGVIPGVTFGLLFGVATEIAFRVSAGITFGVAASSGLRTLGGVFAAIAALRAYNWPFSILFVWPTPRPDWYRYHPVTWDNMCSLPYPRLNVLLVALAEMDAVRGQSEIDRLIETYPTQRTSALSARTIQLARELGNIADLADLPTRTSRLPDGEKGFLRQVGQVHQSAVEIADLQTRLDAVDRPILRQPTAQLLLKTIQSFGHQLAGFEEPLRTEFRAAAKHWEQLAQTQLDEIQNALAREPIQQFFRAGAPVDRNHEAFIARDRVTGELEQQIMLATGCSGVILYGRRRVGKSTVLRDLQNSLPKQQIRVAYLSAGNPDLFASTESFAQAIATATNPTATARNLSELYTVLTKENETLTQSSQRLVLAIDEYEMLDRKIGEGVFTTHLLDTLRESIQSHRAITWILAGSHQITELPSVPWTSYLVSARLVEVPVFSAAETRLLLTTPARYSTLWTKDDPTRPHFDPSFWGEGGLDKIHNETGGWPHLVQLAAETCIDFVNDESAQTVTPALLERALNRSIVRGEAVFYELLRRESALPGEWNYLQTFRRADSQPEPSDPAIARSLRRRELVEIEGDRWSLRVPLMRRWLIERS